MHLLMASLLAAAERCRPLLKVAAGETVILLHPPLGMERECHQNDSLADG